MSRWMGILAGAVVALMPPGAAAQSLDLVLKPLRGPDGQVSSIAVTATIADVPGTPLRLNAPIVYAGVPGIAERMSRIVVRDARGAVELISSDDAPVAGGFPYFRHWTAARAVTYPVTLRYESAVQPPDAPRGPPFGMRAVGGGVAGGGPGFLILPDDGAKGRIGLRWDLSGLPPHSIGLSSFGEGAVVLDGAFGLLRQGWYLAGPAQRFENSADAAFSAAWLGEAPFDVRAEMAWASGLYAYLAKSFAYLDPAPDYRVFMRFLPGAPRGGGTAAHQSFMLSAASGPFDATARAPRATLAHEMIHQWTGQIDEKPGVSSWFSEGLTTYYTALLPYRGGFASIDEVAERIDAMARDYWGSAGRNWSAERIAATGFADESIRRVPYSRSALYFATLDSRIRSASGGRRSLADMLAPMYRRRAQGTRFDHAAWRAMLEAELGPAAAEEWRRVILDGEAFVPDDRAFGPCFKRVDKRYDVGGTPVEGYAFVRDASVPEPRCRSY